MGSKKPRVSSTFGLYSAFLACRAIVLRSKRQSRLTVATIFLYMQDKPRVCTSPRPGLYILQSRNNATDTTLSCTRRTRSRSWSRGSYAVTILTLGTLLTDCALLVVDCGWRGQLTSASWEGKRAGGDEGLCLDGVGGVGLNLIHDGGLDGYFDFRLLGSSLEMKMG